MSDTLVLNHEFFGRLTVSDDRRPQTGVALTQPMAEKASPVHAVVLRQEGSRARVRSWN